MDTCAIASDADIEAYLREFETRRGNVDGPGEWQSLVEASAGASITEAVLARRRGPCLPRGPRRRARTNVVAIEADGRQAFLYELRPQPEADDSSGTGAAPRSTRGFRARPEALGEEPPAPREEQSTDGDEHAGQDRDRALRLTLGELEIGHPREERHQRRGRDHPHEQSQPRQPEAEPSSAAHACARARVDAVRRRAQADRRRDRGDGGEICASSPLAPTPATNRRSTFSSSKGRPLSAGSEV